MREQPVPLQGIAGLVAAYLDSCRARGLSPKTVERAYALPLERDFLPFLEDGIYRGISDIDQGVVDRFSQQLLQAGRSGRKLSPHSVAAYLRPVNQFLNWAREQGHEPKGRAQMPRRRKRELQPLSREELSKLEQAANHERDRVLIRLMGDTGARVGEVASLRVTDLIVRDRQHFLRVRGKTGERYVPIQPKLYDRCLSLTKYRKGADTEPLFVGLLGRPGGRREALTVTGIYQAVKEAAARAELGKRVHPHGLRHAAITHMVARNMHPVLIADITGASLTVIESVYSHLGFEDRHRGMMRVLDE